MMSTSDILYHQIPQREEKSRLDPEGRDVETRLHLSNETYISRRITLAMLLIILVQTAIILMQYFNVYFELRSVPTRYTTGLNLTPNKERMGDKRSSFWSHNETSSTEAWDSIEAGHGVVAIEKTWASSIGLPETHTYWEDDSKGIYVISAYHAIHCLKFLRKHFLALKQGEAITWSEEHDMHCFDSLRQHVMCQADDTLLYTTGDRDAGHGQVRQCKDWDKLRDWATEHTSCYADLPHPAPRSRWRNCDGGEDGLPRGSLLD